MMTLAQAVELRDLALASDYEIARRWQHLYKTRMSEAQTEAYIAKHCPQFSRDVEIFREHYDFTISEIADVLGDDV